MLSELKVACEIGCVSLSNDIVITMVYVLMVLLATVVGNGIP